MEREIEPEEKGNATLMVWTVLTGMREIAMLENTWPTTWKAAMGSVVESMVLVGLRSLVVPYQGLARMRQYTAMNANWTMVRVTGNLNRLRMALPVLEESAEVVYQSEQSKTKRTVDASNMDDIEPVAAVRAGEGDRERQREEEEEENSFSLASERAVVINDARSASAGVGRTLLPCQFFSSMLSLLVHMESTGGQRPFGAAFFQAGWCSGLGRRSCALILRACALSWVRSRTEKWARWRGGAKAGVCIESTSVI